LRAKGALTTATETPTPAIQLDGVSFTYRNADSPALRGVTLAVDSGRFAVLMGRTGAGKSTLCQCLNGLVPRFHKGNLEGEVRIFGEPLIGRDVVQLSPIVGMVFQDFEGQLFCTKASLEVAFGPENLALPHEEIVRRVEDALKTVGLEGYQDRDPSTLSGGQKQRLAIASVLAMQPKLVILDEPTTDLDPIGKRAIFEVAGRLRDAGTTLLMVEHETEEVLDADCLGIMADGALAYSDSPERILLQDPAKLVELGVRPPDVPAYFRAIGETRPPMNLDAAVERFHRLGLQVTVRSAAADSYPLGETLIEAEDLWHVYPPDVAALRGVSVSVREGEFVAVIGQNGCGKTTLVKHFNGLLKATAGQVRFRRRDASELGVAKLGRHVGYVFQNPDHQIFAETVREEVMFGPRNFGVPEQEAKERVTEALEAVELTGREDADPFSLTRGERQRVAVASVLASRPEVLILDEPTTGLDTVQQRRMMELLLRLNKAGHTIIIVTHSMWVVAEYARRCIVMSRGEILRDGPTREVFADDAALERAALRPPRIVEFSRRLGCIALSPQELAARTVFANSGTHGRSSPGPARGG